MAELAALVGDPARTNILVALNEDKAIPAGTLAEIAGVSPSTASEHLAKLTEAGLIKVERQGRRRVYHLADPAVGELLYGIETLARSLARTRPEPTRYDQARVHARICLDHVAGELGGLLAGAVVEAGYVRHRARGVEITPAGMGWLDAIGADTAHIKAAPRRPVGFCHDWTADLPHLGGAFGGAMMSGFVRNDWLRYDRASGLVTVTPKGRGALRTSFGLDLSAPA